MLVDAEGCGGVIRPMDEAVQICRVRVDCGREKVHSLSVLLSSDCTRGSHGHEIIDLPAPDRPAESTFPMKRAQNVSHGYICKSRRETSWDVLKKRKKQCV